MSDRSPPEAVRSACRRGLELAPKYGGDGLTAGAKSRARSMANGQPISTQSARRMVAWFARHDANYTRQASPPSPGYVAYLLWGGASGRAWAKTVAGDSDTEKSMDRWSLEDLDMFAKADKRPKWKQKGWVGPGGAWETAKRKAKEQGKPESYARAIYAAMTHKSESSSLPYLDEYLAKAGFGSHGGRVIGFTPSAKPIYQSSQLAGAGHLHARMSAKGKADSSAASQHNQHFQGHSEEDHNAAAAAHKEAGAAANARGNDGAAKHHDNMSNMHADMANHVASRGAPKGRMKMAA